MESMTGCAPRPPAGGGSARWGEFRRGVLHAAALIGFGVPLFPVPGVAQDAVAVLERAAERYAALEGFCADFRQEIQVTLLRQTARSRGELCQARSDRFEMRFTEPEGDRVVADGVHLWVYFPSTDDGQVFRTGLGGGEGRFDLHREFLSDPGVRYAARLEGREVLEGRDVFVLDLTPLVPSPYVNARVWIDASDHLIRRLVILEDSESIRTLDLSNIRLNPAMDETRFRFDPPSGVQVIAR
jgi:outer membrane lipoprotein carrier protein